MRIANAPLALLAGAALLSACTSSDESATVVGLTPPSALEIVTPVNEGAAPTAGAAPAASDPGFPASSDYATDPVDTYVYDPAVEPLQIINMILCFMGQVGATELVNQGAYLALVDRALCEQGNNQGSGGGGQEGSEFGGLELWPVLSERASNVSAQNVHLWVPEPNQGITIFVDIEVTASASAANPFGQFAMNYAGADSWANIGSANMIGHLSTVSTPLFGDVGFVFYENQGNVDLAHGIGDWSSRVEVRVEMNADQTAGWAKIRSTRRENFGGVDSGPVIQEFEVAFDETHFMRSTDGAPAIAYDREAFTENVWEYGLYHNSGTPGQEVELDGGFSIEDGDGAYGWAGYYGLWMPEGVELAHGDLVTAGSGSDNAGDEYTVVVAPGRLIRNSTETLALTALDGMTFEFWTWNSGTQQDEVLLLEYDEVGGDWMEIGVIDPSSGDVTDTDPAQVVDTAALEQLHLWSEALGGPVSFIDGDSQITYFVSEIVSGDSELFDGSGLLNLLSFDQCLKAGISQGEAELGDVYLPTAADLFSPYNLQFRESDLTLYLDTDGAGDYQPVGLGAGQEPSTGPNTWGMNSGPLLTAAAASSLSSVHDGWNASEFYTYETGHNDWNRFTALRAIGGDLVTFDQPLPFNYVHSQADDRNDDATYDGATFLLQYEGAGQLHGIPHEGVDLNGDSNPDRWYPVANLQDGTVLTDGEGTEYVVKALSIEQALAEDPGYAGTLDVSQASSLTLPDGSEFSMPTIGEAPVITEAPKVIEGEPVQ